jgi:hypothetical protein
MSAAKSLNKSPAGKENEIWAGFGPVGNTDEQFFLQFSCFHGQKIGFKYF